MDEYLLKEKSSAYRSLVRTEDALPIYDAMHSDDMSMIVSAAQEVLLRTGRMPLVTKLDKSLERSDASRNEGNEAYIVSDHEEALIRYNKAMCLAPKNGRGMKLAIAYRSSFFFQTRAFAESMADVENCLRSGVPPEMERKMRAQHTKCREFGWRKKLHTETIPDQHSTGRFFAMPSRNPQLDTVSKDVGVLVTEGEMKIVAANHINVGTVIAVESAFVSQTNDSLKYLACSFCHRFCLNLTPCSTCCDTAFCGVMCMQLAMKEYHDLECHLSEVLRNTSTECRMALKAVIRMLRMCTMDWNMFVAHTKLFGKNRMEVSTVAEVFNELQIFSLLCAYSEKPFVHGTMYNAAIDCAVVLYYLEKLPDFFPQLEEQKKAASDAVARVMMHLCVFHTHTQMQVVIGRNGMDTKVHPAHNYGWFPLISKIKNSCIPNVIALALNKEVALVALEPIEPKTEITIAYLGHWLEQPLSPPARQRTMFALTGALCRCRLCAGAPTEDRPLSETQATTWRNLDIRALSRRLSRETVDELFPRVCAALAQFSARPLGAHYAALYDAFRACLRYYQACRCPQRLPGIPD